MNRERFALNNQETYFLSVYREENKKFDYYTLDLDNTSYTISSEQMEVLYKYIHNMYNEYTMLRDFKAYFNDFNHQDFLDDLKRLKIDTQTK